jgi:hypothetical protein
MSQPPAKPVLSEADFEAIAAAVQETERGRWFLAEYARRNRHADTQQVLDAIEKLQRSITARGDGTPDNIRMTISDMSAAIARTKAEISSIKPDDDSFGKIADATIELDAIVDTTEKATSEILAGAEQVQEIAWTLRESGLDPAVCDQLDALMTETYTACSFQDLTGQRIRKIVNVLNFLEARIEAMKLIWGGQDAGTPAPEAPSMEDSLLDGPALPGEGLEQANVDDLLTPATAESPVEDDVVWEDAPAEDESDTLEAAVQEALQEPLTDEAVEATAKTVAAELAAGAAVEEAIEEEDVVPLAPAVPPSEPKFRMAEPEPSPIEKLSPTDKLALFS